MDAKGSDFYDHPLFFERYLERRDWDENANDTIEKPIMADLLGDVRGKTVLDLGCGDASIGNELLDAGAAFYTGIDGSENMVRQAQAILKKEKSEVVHHTLEDWDFPVDHYDLILSRLVLHYIEDIPYLFKKVFQALKLGGAFVFSVEHPVMTSSYGMPHPKGMKQDWTVDNYFHSGLREQEWLGDRVRKYHRTVEEYYAAMQSAGFQVEGLRESKPMREHFIYEETYERRMKIPLFLFLKGRKLHG